MAQSPFAGRRFLDANGNPISGGLMYIYEAGTTTPLDAFTDNDLTTPADNPVVLDSGGLFPQRYFTPDEYKFVLKSSDDATTYFTFDNYTVIDPETASAVASETITTNETVAAADLYRLYNSDTSGGNITITADSATLGSGFEFTVVQATNEGNTTTISGTGAQTVNGAASYTLNQQYNSVTLVSLGAAGWSIASQNLNTSIANNTILGNDSGDTAAPSALTGTEATALLDAFTGDSGSGGVKGLVPAPASGDATAGKVKVLGAGGSFIRPTFQFIEEVTGTGATLATTGGNLNTFDMVRIHFHVFPSADDILELQVANSGPTWDTGTNYAYAQLFYYLDAAGASNNIAASNVGGVDSVLITDDSGTYDVEATSTFGCRGTLTLANPKSSVAKTLTMTDTSYLGSTSARYVFQDYFMGLISNTSAITHLRLSWVGGATFASGSYMVVEGRVFG